MFAEAIQFSGGQIVLAPLIVTVIGVLVKWWINSTEKAIQSIAESVARLADTVGGHSREIAVLQAQYEQQHEEIRNLWDHHHQLATKVVSEP